MCCCDDVMTMFTKLVKCKHNSYQGSQCHIERALALESHG